jgi:hypothetical protein
MTHEAKKTPYSFEQLPIAFISDELGESRRQYYRLSQKI